MNELFIFMFVCCIGFLSYESHDLNHMFDKTDIHHFHVKK